MIYNSLAPPCPGTVPLDRTDTSWKKCCRMSPHCKALQKKGNNFTSKSSTNKIKVCRKFSAKRCGNILLSLLHSIIKGKRKFTAKHYGNKGT